MCLYYLSMKVSLKSWRLLVIRELDISQIFRKSLTSLCRHLGGEDFDNRVIDHFVKLWKRKNSGEDITTNLRTMGKLKREVERAKRTLSSQMSVRLEIESFFDGKDLSETLTRAKFEELNIDLSVASFATGTTAADEGLTASAKP